MPWNGSGGHDYTRLSVTRNAPAQSGVYRLARYRRLIRHRRHHIAVVAVAHAMLRTKEGLNKSCPSRSAERPWLVNGSDEAG
jgi:hypothetical protein